MSEAESNVKKEFTGFFEEDEELKSSVKLDVETEDYPDDPEEMAQILREDSEEVQPEYADEDSDRLLHDPADEVCLDAFRNSVTLQGRIYYKNRMKVFDNTKFSTKRAHYNILIKRKTKNGIRGHLIYARSFGDEIVERLAKLRLGTWIRVTGNVEAYKGQNYIKVSSFEEVSPEQLKSMYGEADYFGKPGVITRAPEELDTDIDIEQPLFQQPEVSNEPEIPVLDKEPSFIEDKPYKEEGVDFSEITARVRQISGAETAKEYNEYYPEEDDKSEPEAAAEQVDFLSEDVPVIEPHSRRIAQEQETAVPETETEEEEHDPDSWGTPPKSKEDYAAEPEEVIPAVPEEPKPVPPAAHAPQVHAPVRRTYVPAGSPGMRRVIVRKEEDQEEKPKFRSRFS